FYFSCCMVSLGTMFSSFWILANNSWMQVPVGHTILDGKIIPADWWTITTGSIMRLRWPHSRLPDDRHVRGGHRRLVCASQHPSRRGARDVALGPTSRGADPYPTLLRPLNRPLRARASAGQVCGDPGALEDAAARARGADRDSRRGQRAEPV